MTPAVALLILITAIPSNVAAENTQRLCVSAVAKSSKTIWAEEHGQTPVRPFQYSVQIDDGPIIETDSAKGFEYPIVGPNPRRLIKIRNAGTLAESFWVNFEKFDSAQLCLWFNSLYRTWSIWTLEESRHICACQQ